MQESGKSPARTGARFEASIGFKERNEIIMQVLNKRTLCHIKDLTGALPNISERTVRYDVQRLVDKGTIERVGTGGPNSFFRLLKKESMSKS
jgi:predicted ArsR family transcriptional regulator